jgi:hypothetical protein
MFARQFSLGRSVESYEERIIAADDEQGRRNHSGQSPSSEIDAPTAHHDARHSERLVPGGDHRGRGTGAGAKIANVPILSQLPAQPSGSANEPAHQQIDVKDVGPIKSLVFAQKIEQQSGQSALVE